MLGRHIPKPQYYKLRAFKGVSFFHEFRVTNAYGEEFNFSGKPLRAYMKRSHCSYCKDIPLCVEASGANCSNITISLRSFETEALECQNYTFYVDYNVNEIPEEELDRHLTLEEIKFLGIDSRLKITDYLTYRNLREFLPEDPSFRLVHGLICVTD